MPSVICGPYTAVRQRRTDSKMVGPARLVHEDRGSIPNRPSRAAKHGATRLQQVCNDAQSLLGGGPIQGGLVCALEAQVAQVQHRGHNAQHRVTLLLRQPYDGHGIQRGAQALAIVHTIQDKCGAAGKVLEALCPLLQPAGQRIRATLNIQPEGTHLAAAIHCSKACLGVYLEMPHGM